jgi:hypothetical protein
MQICSIFTHSEVPLTDEKETMSTPEPGGFNGRFIPKELESHGAMIQSNSSVHVTTYLDVYVNPHVCTVNFGVATILQLKTTLFIHTREVGAMVLNITSGTTIDVPWTNDDQSRLLNDQIKAMVTRADVFFTYTNYLVPQSNAASIDEVWRKNAALWMISVVDYYNLDRNIVSTENVFISKLIQPFLMGICYIAVTLIR